MNLAQYEKFQIEIKMTKAKWGNVYFDTRQSTHLCMTWVEANQLNTGQAGTVVLMC